MQFPLYFYLSLMFLSPWPIWISFMFYYGYKFDTTFEYYIIQKKQLYKTWAVILILPLIFSSIFLLRYRRIGLSINLLYVKELLLKLISPLSYIDLGVFLVFLGAFVITWILILRFLYQYFRKCLLTLYLYYLQYKIFMDFCDSLLFIKGYFNDYLWNRVRIFTSSPLAFKITWYIWPCAKDILERNLFRCILPYLILFDFVAQQGVISKIFLILPWYYIYSLLRFGSKFLSEIHNIENWNLSEEMYGEPK